MSEANHRPAPDALDRATDMLRGATVPAGPPAELTAATLAAIQERLAGAVPAENIARKRRRLIMRYVGISTATAAAVVAIMFWLPAQSDAGMFEKAIENAAKAKSFRAKVTYCFDKNNQVEATVMSQNGKARIEMDTNAGPTVMILDFKKKIGLTIIEDLQAAMWMDDPAHNLGLPAAIAKRLVGSDVPTLGDVLGELKGAKPEKLPDEEVEKRKAKVFVVKGFNLPEDSEKSDFTVWIDPKTSTILKFRWEVMTGDNKGTSVDVVLLELNEKIDEKNFDLTVPPGYKEDGKPKNDE